MRRGILSVIGVLALGCGTMNGARPLEKGKQRVGATFGGPVLMSLGPPIPIPSLVVEGRTGLDPIQKRATDINYGINATAIAFGLIDIHAGVSHELISPSSNRPALSITERLHLASNHLDTTKTAETRSFYAINQIDLTTSREFGKQLIYGGGTLYWNFINLPRPGYFLGTELRPTGGDFSIQIEARHMAVGFVPEVQNVEFASLGSGVVSFTAGIGFDFGGSK